MTATPRETLNSMRVILLNAESRKLTDQEKSELDRLCVVLSEGRQNRAIYNQAAREFCGMLKSSVVYQPAGEPGLKELLRNIDSLTTLAG